MITFTFTVMILSGILFIISVLLMSPKWGLWFGIGGMSTSNEYSSKKSVESTLKKSAFLSILIFGISAMVYPYIAKKQLSTSTGVSTKVNTNTSTGTGTQSKQQNIKSNIKLEWVNSNWKKVEVNVKKENSKVNNNVSTWVSK